MEEGLDLSGQPIPEFPLPVATLLITLIVTFAIERLRMKKKLAIGKGPQV